MLGCAVPFMCMDIPTSLKNELGQGCAELNNDPDFKSVMLCGIWRFTGSDVYVYQS